MLYRTCKRMIEKGNTAGMATKLDVFYAANKLTEDEQWAKITLVKRIAERVWK